MIVSLWCNIIIANSYQNQYIFLGSRNMVECRVAQANEARANYMSILTGTTKLQFLRIRNSMIFYPKSTKVAVEVPAYQGKLPTKFEENRIKHFRDMSEQTFEFFLLRFFLLCLFAHLKNRCNPQTCTPIQLKFWSTCRASRGNY